jgi:hypothetical protein
MAGLFANVEAIAMLFNTLKEGLAVRAASGTRVRGKIQNPLRRNAERRPRDCLKRCLGLGSFERGKEMGEGDRATAPFQDICPAVFRVALRIGTKFECDLNAMAVRLGADP